MTDVVDLVRRLQEPRFVTIRGSESPVPLRCHVLPPSHFDVAVLERVLGFSIPEDLRDLWTEAGGMRLFEDVTYGQWGTII